MNSKLHVLALLLILQYFYLLNLDRCFCIKSAFGGAGSEAIFLGKRTGTGWAAAFPSSQCLITSEIRTDK